MFGSLTQIQMIQLVALVASLVLLLPALRKWGPERRRAVVRFAIIWVALAILIALIFRWLERAS